MRGVTSLSRWGQRARRAMIAVYSAVFMTVMMGMAALAVDVGVLYSAQAELQRAADAAALAAAAHIVNESGGDLEQIVVEAANEYAAKNLVLQEVAGLADSDVELGRAVYNEQTGRFAFEPGGDAYDAVRVTLRRSDASSSGPVELFFARFLGHDSRSLAAQASAVLVPRDVSVVIDLSNSMNYDSQLRFWDRDDGGYTNTRDIWAALDGPEPARPYMPGSELETEYADDTGPSIGAMDTWGNPLLPGSYSASNDPGLWYVRRYQSTYDANAIASLGDRGYTSEEIDVLASGAQDSSSTRWRNRVAVTIGVANWRSGKEGAAFGGSGDGDDVVDSWELDWLPTPDFRIDWSWTDYINYVGYTNVYQYDKTEFRWRYGLKTFTDFLLESEPQSNETDGLWGTPQQPLRAVKDAVQVMADVINDLQGMDQISLEIFASTARHEVNLTRNYQQIPDLLYQRQSGHYNRSTNIAGGLVQAIAELQSSRARPAAKKVIVLMSDGVANTNEDGDWLGDGSPEARQYALDRAQEAADNGFVIYTVSVGYGVDRALMQEIATIGKGQEFYAVGSPEEYTEQLEDIFRTLGGRRPVALIE